MKYTVAFDVETTGLSFKDDYIIQLSAVKFDENFEIIEEFDEMVCPKNDFEVAEGALSKHGFTKEFVMENGRPLNEVGEEFLSFIEGCDMLSYNGRGFDVRMIVKDFRAVGLEFSLDKVFYDSYLLESMLNSRKLECVYERYTGKKLDNAHNALYDVRATVEIFKHQLELFEKQDISLDDVMNFDESKIFCIDGMIYKKDDNIFFAKGKYKDSEFMQVCSLDPGYIAWFMKNPEFDITTKLTLKKYYAERK